MTGLCHLAKKVTSNDQRKFDPRHMTGLTPAKQDLRGWAKLGLIDKTLVTIGVCLRVCQNMTVLTPGMTVTPKLALADFGRSQKMGEEADLGGRVIPDLEVGCVGAIGSIIS